MQNVKGTFDYWGMEQAIRKKVQNVLERLFTLYDYDAMETPVLNEQTLLASKYAGGDEILKEMYRLQDQGNRSLALRYDLTIPFAKVTAMNPGLELPFKRYEIGKVFRDGPVKRGRLREFIQCDADAVGIEGPEAEAELMQLAVDAFGALDIDIVIRWNNRKFLGELLSRIGVPAETQLSVMLTLDKLAKIGAAGVENELLEKGIPTDVSSAVMELIQREQTSCHELVEAYGILDSQGTKEVNALQSLLDKTGLGRWCAFDPFLSRGLSFYTGTVYEIFDKTETLTSSLGGGGRYDSIIGKLVDRDDIRYPAVGLSFGIESIMELLKERGVAIADDAVVIMPIGNATEASLLAASTLRTAGIRTRIDWSGRKLKKLLAAASSKGVRFVILIGDEEAATGQVRLKDMAQSTERDMSAEEAADVIRAAWQPD
ncbi:histidine--tRNA ligase [Paenibacillus allorhizosphaerae]|uniref:Histidine--tRNA ligase n=1 Tax=Paenibacillus allorhizosphaerae TaxID=2849866 RepID=A0ABN7TLH4_9BACL|nr:histidine--tRNA ligase [Paenibacillus allorhizosphaerae]CAG7636478.1 Histidine--tRNA ligase [Paenibacillus allorhizosphaerae]